MQPVHLEIHSIGYRLKWNGGTFVANTRYVTLDADTQSDLISALMAGGKVSRLASVPVRGSVGYATLSAGERAKLPGSLPRFTGPVVVIGRGESSDKFQERYRHKFFGWVGVNPGTTVYHESDPSHCHTQGKHAEVLSFDCVVSVDSIYLQRMGLQYLSQYHGPVITKAENVGCYSGPGTIHSAERLCFDMNLAGESALLAVQCAIGLGATRVILCGFDYLGEKGLRRRPYVRECIEKIRSVGVPVEFDKGSPWQF